ncbi:MAG: ArsR/SmtB family transcription factor [Gaiellaceae bacterium]
MPSRFLTSRRTGALAEPMRIKLLDRLREGEATVLELTALVGTTQQNVSKHLNLLQHAGMVARRKQGNFSYYRIADETVYALCEAVCGSLQSRFDALKEVAGRTSDQAWPKRTSGSSRSSQRGSAQA